MYFVFTKPCIVLLTISIVALVDSHIFSSRGHENKNNDNELLLHESYKDLKTHKELSEETLPRFDDRLDENLPEEISTVECDTSECREAARRIQSHMDISVDPCENFYDFTCGNYTKAKVLENREWLINGMMEQGKRARGKLLDIIESDQEDNSKVVQKMKMFFQDCTSPDQQQKNIAFIKNLLDRVNGWPVVVGDNWNEDNFDYGQVFRHLTEYLLAVPFPVSMVFNKVDQVSHTSSGAKKKFDVYIKFPGNNMTVSNDVTEKIQKMIDLAIKFGANMTVAEKDVEEMYLFEAKLMILRDLISNPTSDPPRLVDEDSLKHEFPWISYWDDLLKKKSERFGLNETVTYEELNLNIVNPKFASVFQDILDDTPKRVQANYMIYTSLLSILEYVIDDYDTPLKDIPHLSKKDFCFKELARVFNRAVPSLYFKSFVSERNFEAIRNISENIKDQYLKELIRFSYPNALVANAKEFYKTLEIVYGYFESLMDEKSLDAHYADLNLDKSSFYEVVIEAKRFIKKEKSTISTEMLTFLKGNAFFDNSTQRIGISTAIMEAPFFSADNPTAMNYGGFGFIFAHELAHGLLRNPLLDFRRTDENALCIIEQYNNISIYESSYKLDSIRTVEENLCDNAAVRVVYDAYINETRRNGFVEQGLPGFNYTARQLFWIGTVSNWCQKISNYNRDNVIQFLARDTHTPLNVRFNLALMNMKEFSEDFHCKLGSQMNPVTRCSGLRK